MKGAALLTAVASAAKVPAQKLQIKHPVQLCLLVWECVTWRRAKNNWMTGKYHSQRRSLNTLGKRSRKNFLTTFIYFWRWSEGGKTYSALLHRLRPPLEPAWWFIWRSVARASFVRCSTWTRLLGVLWGPSKLWLGDTQSFLFRQSLGGNWWINISTVAAFINDTVRV